MSETDSAKPQAKRTALGESKTVMNTKNFLAGILMLMMTQNVNADGLSNGRVAYVYVSHQSGGFVLVRLHGVQQGTQPACATNANTYAFSLAELGGFGYLSIVQNAMAQNREIKIIGTGACTVSGAREDVESIEIVNP